MLKGNKLIYSIKKYSANSFILVLPVLAWNIILTPLLPQEFQPEVFNKGVPAFITTGETVSRLFIFVLLFLIPLRVSSAGQRKGLALYITGLALYFLSWMPLIYYPGASWSKSLPGFLAPSLTPIIWLTGIAFISGDFYFRFPYGKEVFVITIAAFILFHNLHTVIVYKAVG